MRNVSSSKSKSAQTGRSLLALSAICLLSGTAQAATVSWTGATSADWNTGSNWNPGLTPPASGDTALFNGPGNGNVGVSLSSGAAISSITFDTANAAAYTIGTAGGPALTLQPAGTIQTTSSVANAQTVNGPLSLTGNYNFSSNASSSANTLNFGGTITTVATSALTLRGTNTGANTISGVIGDGTGLMSVSLAAGSNWVLTATNTYTGATSVATGATLTVGSAGQLGATGTYAGAIANTGTFNYNSSAAQTFSGAISGAVTTAAFNVKNGTVTVSGNNSAYKGRITVDQGATLVSSAANSMSGGLVTVNGSLNLGVSNNVSPFTGLVGTGTVSTIASSGTALLYVGAAGTSSQFDGVLKDGATAKLYLNNKGGMQVLTGSNTFTGGVNISGTISVTQLSDTVGAGSALGYGGAISMPVGSVLIYNTSGTNAGSTSRIGVVGNSGAGTITFDSSSASSLATLTLGGTIATNANVGNTNTIVLQGSNTGANTISAVVKNSALNGSTALTKNGTGTWILSGNNSYTGATTVNAGTLLVDGSINASSAVAVNAGGALGGNGFARGAVTVNSNGTLTPGNSPGLLTLGATTLNGGGNYNWQILDATGAAGTGFDTINLTPGSALTLNNTSGDTFNINLWSLNAVGPDANGDALNFGASNSWTLIATDQVISNFSADKFTINVGAINGTAGFTNSLAGGTFSVGLSGDSTDLLLIYTAVPEPSTWLLVTAAGTVMIGMRRRRIS